MSKDTIDEDFISKSQIKREMNELHSFGKELVELSASQRSQLPMDEELHDALLLADKIKNKREAYKRHLNFLAKLLRSRDLDELNVAMDRIRSQHSQSNAFFHKMEALRDTLIAEDDKSMNQVIEMNHEIDRQKLRQLVRKAKKEQTSNQPPQFYRELFKFLRDNLEGK